MWTTKRPPPPLVVKQEETNDAEVFEEVEVEMTRLLTSVIRAAAASQFSDELHRHQHHHHLDHQRCLLDRPQQYWRLLANGIRTPVHSLGVTDVAASSMCGIIIIVTMCMKRFKLERRRLRHRISMFCVLCAAYLC